MSNGSPPAEGLAQPQDLALRWLGQPLFGHQRYAGPQEVGPTDQHHLFGFGEGLPGPGIEPPGPPIADGYAAHPGFAELGHDQGEPHLDRAADNIAVGECAPNRWAARSTRSWLMARLTTTVRDEADSGSVSTISPLGANVAVVVRCPIMATV